MCYKPGVGRRWWERSLRPCGARQVEWADNWRFTERERAIMAGGLKLGYEFIAGYTAFVRGAVDHRLYDNLDAFNPLDRDSDVYLIEVGTDLDPTGVLFGDGAIGYKSQDYAEPGFDTVGGVGGGRLLGPRQASPRFPPS